MKPMRSLAGRPEPEEKEWEVLDAIRNSFRVNIKVWF
jgi:hypothetical protein